MIRRAALWGTAIVLLLAAVASAHGPCDCLEPSRASPGDRVQVRGPTLDGTVGYLAYRILFNPRQSDLGIAPPRLGQDHRPDAPTITLLDRPRTRPTRTASFQTPRVPPGRYLVVIWDGEEGGAHNTWEHLVVRSSANEQAKPAQQEVGSEGDNEGISLVAWLAAGAVLTAAVSAALLRRGSSGSQ